MSRRVIPQFLRVYRGALARRDAISTLVARALSPSHAAAPRVVAEFAFKSDEHRFARALLTEKTQMWLYRVSQRAFSGDFVVIDASNPSRAKRRVYVLDLKLGAPVKRGGGGAGVQLKNAPRVVRDLALATGVIDEETPFELVTGGSDAVLGMLGVSSPA
jgi:hypothetical protein